MYSYAKIFNYYISKIDLFFTFQTTSPIFFSDIFSYVNFKNYSCFLFLSLFSLYNYRQELCYNVTQSSFPFKVIDNAFRMYLHSFIVSWNQFLGFFIMKLWLNWAENLCDNFCLLISEGSEAPARLRRQADGEDANGSPNPDGDDGEQEHSSRPPQHHLNGVGGTRGVAPGGKKGCNNNRRGTNSTNPNVETLGRQRSRVNGTRRTNRRGWKILTLT